MKEDAEALVKLFAWGDKNNIVVGVRRFRQYSKNCKDFTRYYEVDFLEVAAGTNAGHRTSVAKDEDLMKAMMLAWDNYGR